MNGFDVQAVGWLVTRDMCWQATGALLGLKPAITLSAAQQLVRQWQALVDTVDQDAADQPFTTRLLTPRRTRLSKRSEAAMRAFVDRLVASCHERYAAPALRSRCVIAAARTAASLVCCLLLGQYVSPEHPTVGQACFAFLLMGFWYLATGVQLFRTYRLVRVLYATQVPACEPAGTQLP